MVALGYDDVVIGITTFERLLFVESQCLSLSLCKGIEETCIVLIDDQSTTYEMEYIYNIYGFCRNFSARRQRKSGADEACRNIISDMIEKEREVLILLDSDLICDRSFIDVVLQIIPYTEGIFSLFNAPAHSVVSDEGIVVTKESLGAAGCVMTRAVAIEILANVPAGPRFDWRFCKYLRERGVVLKSVKNSVVQHLGYSIGQNSRSWTGDYGRGFRDYSAENLSALLEAIVTSKQDSFRHMAISIHKLSKDIEELRKILYK